MVSKCERAIPVISALWVAGGGVSARAPGVVSTLSSMLLRLIVISTVMSASSSLVRQVFFAEVPLTRSVLGDLC